MRLLAKPVYQSMVLVVLITSLSACAIFSTSQEVQPSPASSKPSPWGDGILPNSKALVDLPIADIVYAQNALNKLGYQIGSADGIWGPKSATAIRKFERSYDLQSAGGHLSELNLYALEKITKLTRSGEATQITLNQNPLSARVDARVPLEGAPQLVIIERTRALLAKPNPYSEVIAKLPSGTGIYVIGLREGWYEVESEGRIRGYLKAN